MVPFLKSASVSSNAVHKEQAMGKGSATMFLFFLLYCIRFLYHDIVQKDMVSGFGFLCTYKSSMESGLSQDSRARYILDVFTVKASENKLFLAPYHFELHWCSLTLNRAFSVFRSAKDSIGKLPISDKNWIKVQVLYKILYDRIPI